MSRTLASACESELHNVINEDLEFNRREDQFYVFPPFARTLNETIQSKVELFEEITCDCCPSPVTWRLKRSELPNLLLVELPPVDLRRGFCLDGDIDVAIETNEETTERHCYRLVAVAFSNTRHWVGNIRFCNQWYRYDDLKGGQIERIKATEGREPFVLPERQYGADATVSMTAVLVQVPQRT